MGILEILIVLGISIGGGYLIVKHETEKERPVITSVKITQEK